ncbi:receptor-like protein 14 isoform X1 [Quercus lobata]|uniref:receptor-like protein 14 isoform X1 n=1 Tax=Quercus lobata TaxID=97700 RepID=UPI0012485F04|nr:receptor-like protein 14 isoform X1 [Quercus lobata]
MELLGRYWWWPVVIVLVHFGMNGCFGCWEQERIALLQYKASTVSYTDESHFTPWDSADKESDCCEWEGVKCNLTTGRVIELTIRFSMTESGGWYFNASLFLPFEELQYLNFGENFIRGWVPNEGFERFSALSKLEVLRLDDNYFNNSILSSLSGIASLKELYLDGNNFNGSIQGFERLSLLSKLEVLDLGLNNFNNSILQSLSGIASLKKLDLSDNNLNGSIHIKEFKAFSNLEELDLSFNMIQDFVTTKDSNILTKLQLLDLSRNDFSAQVLESLTAFPSLKTFLFNENYNLEGSFTTKGWCELRNLQKISLADNHFEGVLPSCMANWTSLHSLDLSGNHFSGNVQSLSDLRSLEFLSLSNNEFLNPITFSSFFNLSNLKFLFSDNNKIAFETNSHTRVPTFQLRIFSLSMCSFNGLNTTLPTFLHYQYDLQEIDLSNNNLKGKFPT